MKKLGILVFILIVFILLVFFIIYQPFAFNLISAKDSTSNNSNTQITSNTDIYNQIKTNNQEAEKKKSNINSEYQKEEIEKEKNQIERKLKDLANQIDNNTL